MDGAECPDADLCREHKPETCPLFDDQFELDATQGVDIKINHDYRYTIGD
jgi:hypothetical protein